MKYKGVLLFLIRENIIVATAVTALAISTLHLFHQPMAYAALCSLWVGTILSYSLAKEGQLRYDHPCWWALAAIACGAFLFLSKVGQGLLLLSGLLSMAYNAPYRWANLRHLPFLKVVIVALCWVLGSVYLPLSETPIPLFSKPVSLLALQYFLWVVVLILPFDIRDRSSDAASLYTLPTALGTVKTKVIGSFLMLLYMCIAYRSYPLSLLLRQGIAAFLTLILLLCAHERQSPLYSGLWVESIPIVYTSLVTNDQ